MVLPTAEVVAAMTDSNRTVPTMMRSKLTGPMGGRRTRR